MALPWVIPRIEEYRSRHATWAIEHGGRQSVTTGRTVSIVTVTYNCAPTLDRTIKSVIAQTHSDIEYIIVDGASNDSTMEIVRRYRDHLTAWVSEKDEGISDAFNKGISLTSGAYIMIVNGDDWLSPDNLRHAVETLERSGAEFAFGDQKMWRQDGSSYAYFGDPHYACLIRRRMPAINHPTVLVRRDAYERFGLFVKELRYGMDYELLLRFHLAGALGIYDARIVGNMSVAGASDRNYTRGLAECRRIAIAHGLPKHTAWHEYLYSLCKGCSRRVLQAFLPEAWLAKLWQRVNPQFGKLPPDQSPPVR